MGGGVLLLVEVEGHHVVFPQVFNFTLFINQFALLILQFFFGDDPVVVDALTLLLEVCQQLLLLLVGAFQLAQLLSHGELYGRGGTLNYSDSVSLTLLASLTPCCSMPGLGGRDGRGRGRSRQVVAWAA